MPPSATQSLGPLTIAEQLDAMLLGWLEHHADAHGPTRAGLEALAVITVADRVVEEVETFCAGWDMTVARAARGHNGWAVLSVRGPALPVRGFSEITQMYRR